MGKRRNSIRAEYDARDWNWRHKVRIGVDMVNLLLFPLDHHPMVLRYLPSLLFTLVSDLRTVLIVCMYIFNFYEI
jgi:hypothetical protein